MNFNHRVKKSSKVALANVIFQCQIHVYSITAELGKEKKPIKNSLRYIIPTLEVYLCVSIQMHIYTYVAQLRASVYKMEGCVGKGIKCHRLFHSFLWNSLQLCIGFSTR